MIDSADTPRERRRLETERLLVAEARTLAAAHGLPGFTVEQLCERGEISRRTFFNYFASKEDAVLGFPLHRRDVDAERAFVAGGTTPPGRLSPDLLDALAVLVSTRWATMDIDPASAAALFAAVEREPRLIPRMLEHAAHMERTDARLIEEREGLDEGDLRARVTAHMMGAIARDTAGAFLGPDREHGRSYADLYAERLAAARSLFSTQDISLEGPPA
ncbi:helix-turn-helix domain-containing protein [Microbacterium sp. NPDC089189]|uniref:TetR/AcrR family transcriptional regulator n=1 Tax=Microbacterium sp. NPDC089189 TaxID=3154972 RepID=UPI00342D9BF4